MPASATLKNLLVIAAEPGESAEPGEVVAIGVPGDREVDLRRVEELLGPVRIFEAADFAAHPELVRGYVGPQGLAGRAFRYVADRAGRARHQLGHRRQPSPTRTPATWSPAATSPSPSTPTW